jgi:hypothetical protein
LPTVLSHQLTTSYRTSIFVVSNKRFFSMPCHNSAPQFLVMTWLALLLIGVITGDFVEDLAFEPVELDDSAGTVPASEEPDEHMLMPSPRVPHVEGIAGLAFSMPADTAASSLEPRLSRVSQLPCSYQKESSRPPSSVQVLRI